LCFSRNALQAASFEGSSGTGVVSCIIGVVAALSLCGSKGSCGFLAVARSELARPDPMGWDSIRCDAIHFESKSESKRAFEPLEAHVCGRVDNNQLPVSAFYWRHQIGFPWKSALQPGHPGSQPSTFPIELHSQNGHHHNRDGDDHLGHGR